MEKTSKLLKERIKENEKLFKKKELKIIYSNINIIKKVYLLGILDNNFNAVLMQRQRKVIKNEEKIYRI